MLAELTAIKTALAATLTATTPSVVVGIGEMNGRLPPFASIWSGPGNRSDDEAVAGVGEYSASVGVTLTAARSDAAILMALDAIAALTPYRRPAQLAVAGRSVWIEFDDARPVQIDRDVTLPGSNTHPAFVVAQFTVHSQPV